MFRRAGRSVGGVGVSRLSSLIVADNLLSIHHLVWSRIDLLSMRCTSIVLIEITRGLLDGVMFAYSRPMCSSGCAVICTSSALGKRRSGPGTALQTLCLSALKKRNERVYKPEGEIIARISSSSNLAFCACAARCCLSLALALCKKQPGIRARKTSDSAVAAFHDFPDPLVVGNRRLPLRMRKSRRCSFHRDASPTRVCHAEPDT